ncbi:MAG TPA: ADOP family duplicated permease [Dokdonella sp.]|uniref:ADOP family duplicated permease n=1 Tax=Dokdonella sp. TaxID=2291710 RepID=UPI002D80F5B7|nr:ADOP family duplicated permease [Dokdonella sp.]HET9033604.1 ADOP family duplicated permease [Dokdonella sp.]
MQAIRHEFKQALRSIVSQPAFSMFVVGVLAAGLTAVIYALIAIDHMVVRPLPFPAAEQLLSVGLDDGSDRGGNLDPVRTDDVIALRRHLAGVAEVSAFTSATINLSDLDRPERYDGAFVSSNLFHVLGVAPLLGRDFNAADERDGAPSVVMLSHDLWASRYGSDPAVIGRQIRANSHPVTIVGVMPEYFSYPRREVIWMAKPFSAGANPDLSFALVLRRNMGVTDSAVRTAVGSWFDDASRAEPEHFLGLRATVQSLGLLTVDETTRSVLKVMLVAALLVLLIACANAANLLLTRTLARRQELAIRVALGASRSRLTLHLLAQSLLLSLIAAVVAVSLAGLAANWTDAAFRASFDGPPRWIHFTLDGRIIAMTFVVVLVTALVAGLLPALRAGGSAMAGDLRDGVRNVGAGFARISRVLMIGEVTLSLTLLISVGVLAGIVSALDNTDLGIDPHGILTARVGLFENAYPQGGDQVRQFEAITDRLRADPAVIGVTAGTNLPGLGGDQRQVLADGDVAGDGDLPRVNYAAVDDQFLSAFSIQMQGGRFFDSRDSATATAVAVVDQRFADLHGGKEDMVGRRFRLDPRDKDAALVTVVGVIPALRMGEPDNRLRPTLLVPLRQNPARFVSLGIHVKGDPAAFAPRLVEDLREVAPDTPAYWVRSYADAIREATFATRLLAKIFAAFGVLALALAGAGLYGVVAFNVGQRTREIGVRRALGASPASVLRDVLTRAGWQVGLGLALGLGCGLALARVLTSVLNSPGSSHALTIVGAIVVLMAAATIAVVVPARRALRVDPMEALRHE